MTFPRGTEPTLWEWPAQVLVVGGKARRYIGGIHSEGTIDYLDKLSRQLAVVIIRI